MVGSESRSLIERFLGRPRRWVGWVWLALSVGQFVLAFLDPSSFRFFIAASWLVLGVLYLIGAYSARRRAGGGDVKEQVVEQYPSEGDPTR